MEPEFLSWETLTTCAGALVMVMILTQLTKDIRWFRAVPAQLLSYLYALLVLFPAAYFTGSLNAADAVLIFFNGAVVALASNGGYDLLTGKKQPPNQKQ